MLKQIIEMAIAMGMETFTVRHCSYEGKLYKKTKEEILEFIEGFEDAIPMKCWFGTYYSQGFSDSQFSEPQHCHITYRLENEKLPRYSY